MKAFICSTFYFSLKCAKYGQSVSELFQFDLLAVDVFFISKTALASIINILDHKSG